MQSWAQCCHLVLRTLTNSTKLHSKKTLLMVAPPSRMYLEITTYPSMVVVTHDILLLLANISAMTGGGGAWLSILAPFFFKCKIRAIVRLFKTSYNRGPPAPPQKKGKKKKEKESCMVTPTSVNIFIGPLRDRPQGGTGWAKGERGTQVLPLLKKGSGNKLQVPFISIVSYCWLSSNKC